MLEILTDPDPQIRAALISAAATGLAAAIGFTAVWWQIGRQSRAAIASNRQNEALKRKLEIYERVLATSSSAQESLRNTAAYLRGFVLATEFYGLLHGSKMNPAPPPQTYQGYIERREKAWADVIAVMSVIEAWHIVEPKLDIVRKVIAFGMDAHREAATQDGFGDVLMRTMPTLDFDWRQPDPEMEGLLRDRVRDETKELDRLAAWVGDYQIEMQILLLSELFENKVERRDPPDPDHFCLRLDRYDEIKQKIAKTSWSKKSIEQQAEARKRFSKSSGNQD